MIRLDCRASLVTMADTIQHNNSTTASRATKFPTEEAMQKRNRAAPVLPVTAADASKPRLRKRKAKELLRPSDAANLGVRLVLIIVGLGIFGLFAQRTMINQVVTPEQAGRTLEDQELLGVPPKPLAEFSSLQYALENSQLVAIYFAASWCPMSTPVTNMLDEKLRDVILPPPKEGSPTKLLQRHGLSLVYVSSDTSAEQMESYLRTNWITVPFDSPDRNNLKRRFRTCAKRELKPLDMEREYEIPTLVVVAGASHQVLTYAGVQDLKEHGVQAVDHWLELERISTALESKYDTIL